MTDDTAAPSGCDSIMVLVPCPTLERERDWADLSRDDAIKQYKEQFNTDVVNDARQAVLQKMDWTRFNIG